jgi:hypothetical protein
MLILVNRGEWLDLTGIMEQKDEVSRTILNKINSAKSQNDVISIRME